MDKSLSWIFSVVGLLICTHGGSVLGQTCDVATCTLPDCYCPKAGIPGGLAPASIPQTVLFMFDGSLTSRDYFYYDSLFTDTKLNPNGCPIGATVFVANNYTDYGAVRKLYLKGIEIGVNSVTRRNPSDWWKTATVDQLEYEVLEQRKNIETKAGIPRKEIWGWRSPYQQTSDTTLSVLKLNDFEYDSTVTAKGWSGNSTIPGWPFTLDSTCPLASCPSQTFPGLWEIPIVPTRDIKDELPCLYLGGCINQPTNKAEVLAYMRKNFEANYNNNRAPVYFNLRTAWLLTEPYVLEGLTDFINELVAMEDVYIITAHQLLAWVKSPQTLAQSKEFGPWTCPNFVNNDISIWDHIRGFFTDGKERASIIPEVPVTPRPRRINAMYYVSSGTSKQLMCSVLLLAFAVLFSRIL